jgi:hypothetical protein
VGTCCSGESGQEIRGSELSYNCGVPGRLVSLSVAEVIAASADCSSLLTLAVSSSESLPVSGSERFSSDV